LENGGENMLGNIIGGLNYNLAPHRSDSMRVTMINNQKIRISGEPLQKGNRRSVNVNSNARETDKEFILNMGYPNNI
jgi:hypothetical protein